MEHGERAPFLPGPVTVTFDRPEPARTARAVVATGAIVVVDEPPRLAPLAPAPPAVERGSSRGLSPAFFWSGAAATVVLGGFTLASALDTASLHDDFITDGPRTPETRDRGQRAETRTNVLIGATAVVAVATGFVGMFLTRWAPRSGAVARAF